MTQPKVCYNPIACSRDGICGCKIEPIPAVLHDSEAVIPLRGAPPRQTPGGHHAHYDYEVKSWPWLFEPMMAGKKKHDMRDMRDRPYKIGDRMLLREFDPRTGKYTGREGVALITYITNNETPCAMSSVALNNDHAILSVNVFELGETDRNA